MWNEAREIAIFRAYIQGRATADLMREHGVGRTRINAIVKNRLVRLRRRGLHRQLQAAGVPELLLSS